MRMIRWMCNTSLKDRIVQMSSEAGWIFIAFQEVKMVWSFRENGGR